MKVGVGLQNKEEITDLNDFGNEVTSFVPHPLPHKKTKEKVFLKAFF